MEMTLNTHLQNHSLFQPDKVFWRHLSGSTATEIGFGEFYARCISFSNAYLGGGLRPNDVVLIFLPHHIDAVAAFFGAMLAGAVPSFMPCPSAKQHPSIYWPEHRALLRRIAPHIIVSDRAHANQMRAHGLDSLAEAILAVEDIRPDDRAPALPDIGGDAIALLQHSSGTTSLKKGVALSHRAILRQVEAYAERLGMGGRDNIVSWLPLYHDMGLIAATVMPLVLGQTVTSLDPFQWVARPASLFDAIERHDGHFTWLPNFAFEHLTRAVPQDHAVDLSGMKAFINCSEPCKPLTFERFQTRFAGSGVTSEQLRTCYAMAETVFAVSQTPAGRTPGIISVAVERLHGSAAVAADARPGEPAIELLSTGRPLDGMSVRIRHGDRDLPDNAIGEVVLSGEFLFDGYLNDIETTRARLSGGRYHTRDRGFMRDGELYILGRLDDLLIVSGRNLHAHEVEAIVGAVPGLKPGRAVAFGVDNRQIGSEELIVVAERDAGAGSGQDRTLARSMRDAIYEQTNIEAKACLVVDPGWLVKTTSGKIGRGANRTKYLDEFSTSASMTDATAVADGTLGRLAGIIAGFFGCAAETIRHETVAGEVDGWDSLAHATLVLEIERQFAIRFADAEIFGFACVGDLVDRIDTLLAEGVGSFSDRVVYKSDAASIVRLGSAVGPEMIVFAGLAKKFGGLENLELSSVLAQSSVRDATKYFVTDHCRDWYTTCAGEVTAALNALSDTPKILIGTSMGGHGALRFATTLRNVASVLAFVPQRTAPEERQRESPRPREDFWEAKFAPGIRYCLLYGELEDTGDKEHMRRQMNDATRQHMLIVPGIGHGVVPFLHKRGLLARVLECSVRPDSMASEIAAIIAAL